MAVNFSNTVFSADQATSGVVLFNSFTGTSLLSGATPVTINGSIDLPGSTVQVSISVGGVTSAGSAGTYIGYSTATDGNYVYYFNVTGGDLVTPVTIGVTGAASLPTIGIGLPVVTTNVPAPIGPNTPCYAEGTRIRTVRGDVAVEHLAIGDEVVTASGGRRPVVWLGHRRTECARHPAPATVLPIRIRAGAIAPGMPARDLRVSPDHALFFDDVLVQARFLVNGSTIVRDRVDAVTYWHVELDRHDVLLAENMPAESYLDVGNRWAFGEGTVVALRPAFSADNGGHCAPLVTDGERLVAIRTWLAERARHLGSRTTADSALRLLADGVAVAPLAAEGGRFSYAVPAGVRTLRLVSRAAVPQEVTADSGDGRRLGICVTALELDGAAVALGDPRLAAGWHEAEADLRWTDGDAVLPVARSVVLSAHAFAAYPISDAGLGARGEARMPLRMVG